MTVLEFMDTTRAGRRPWEQKEKKERYKRNA